MSFKRLFARSIEADPQRLHFAPHSHHLWPDASFDGQTQCWLDAARLADRKWDKVMGEVWPEAQGHVARELGTGAPDAIVFAPNTHELLVRLLSAAPRRSGRALRVLTSDGEFHSARRQLARWRESGEVDLSVVPAEPFGDFSARFLAAAEAGDADVVLISHVLFGSGRTFDPVERLSALGRAEGPWIVIDGYHAFMAIPSPLAPKAAETAFYLGGGYKYAMAGEGVAFLHAPPGFGPRPPITGWYAEFDDLTLPPGMVGYASDARRFLGATFDPSGLYRFNAIRRMLAAEGLDTASISTHVRLLLDRLIGALEATPLRSADLLNPPDRDRAARFLAVRTPKAGDYCAALLARNCIVDHRGDVLRVGVALYHDEEDIDRFAALAATLA